MDKNPIEQQSIKINNFRKEMKEKYGEMFDDRISLPERIEAFNSQLDIYEKEGLVFNKKQIIEGLKECLKIDDREEFVARMLKILDPLMLLKFTKPGIFEKIERNVELNAPDVLRLSEVLSAELEDKAISIHLDTAEEWIKEKGFGNFKKDIDIGLRKLAEIIKSNDQIKEVWATSWIVAKNPALVEKLGFTFVERIPDEYNDAVFLDKRGNKMPFAKASMTRKDFLDRYDR